MDITKMRDGAMLSGDDIDANANRERARQRRLRRKLYLLTPILGYFAYRVFTNDPMRLGVPGWLRGNPEIIIAVGLIARPRRGDPGPDAEPRPVTAHRAPRRGLQDPTR